MDRNKVELPDREYAVLMVSGDIFMGRLELIDGNYCLTKPRMLVLVRKGDAVGIQFVKLLGEPSKVRVPKGTMWYIAEEKQVIEAYIKETTGLYLAK